MISDELAEQFFDGKIAPGLRDKGITEERLQTVREQFVEDVIAAREELTRYRPSDGAGQFRHVEVDGGQQVGVARGYLYGAGGQQPERPAGA